MLSGIHSRFDSIQIQIVTPDSIYTQLKCKCRFAGP